SGCPVLRVLEPVGAVDEVDQAGALRAQGAAVDRVVGIALDVDDVALGILPAFAQRVHQQPAGDRTVGADVAGLGHARQLVLADLGHRGARGHPQGRHARSRQAGARDLEELAPVHAGHEAILASMWLEAPDLQWIVAAVAVHAVPTPWLYASASWQAASTARRGRRHGPSIDPAQGKVNR